MIAWGPRLKDPLQMWRWGKVLFSWRSSTGCEPSLSHRSSNEIQVYSDECVCVEHLNRCQTSTWWCRFWLFVLFSFFSLRDALSTSTAVFNFNIHFRAGGSGRSFGTATNEDTHLIWWYRLGRQSAYLHQFSFFVNGNRPSQEPACRIFHNFHFLKRNSILCHFIECTVSAICHAVAMETFRYLLGSFHRPISVRYKWIVLCTHNAFHIRIRKDCSEQVCDSCWVRHGGMNPSGNTFLGRRVNSRPDLWIYTIQLSNSFK